MKRRKVIILIVILFLLSFIVWNNYGFQSLIYFLLPGDVGNQSILSNDNSLAIVLLTTFGVGVILPLSLLIVCVIKLIKLRTNKYEKKAYVYSLFMIASINILYFVLLALSTAGYIMFYPDLSWHIYWS